MATTTASDFVLYDDLVHAMRTETIAQEVDVFNASSGGTITLETNSVRGEYGKESFFTDAVTINRRDPSSTSSVSATKLSDDELISVKLNRRAGPMRYTADSFKKKDMDVEQASAVIGAQLGQKQAQDMLDSVSKSIVAAIKSVGSSDLVYDGTGGSLTFKKLQKGRRQFGDSSDELMACLIHGDKFHDLVEDGLDNYKIENVAGAQIVTGDIAGAMGLRFVVTDEDGLITTGSPDTYHTVLMPMNAARVEESEPTTTADETITGNDNIEREWQAEYAYNLSLRGFKWDTTNGGANPNDSTLSTGTNWDVAASFNKELAGVVVDSD